MYIVVAGITTLGRRLVKRLESRHDVVVIDEDKDKCERLYSSTGATVINKPPSTITALEDAGITKADALISALPEDNQNMVVSSLAKKYGVPKVVSRVENDEYLEAFEIIGSETIAHTDILISEFLSTIEHPYLVKLANLPQNNEILRASVKQGSKIEGKTPKQLQKQGTFPESFEIVSVLQNNKKTVNKNPGIELESQDQVILIGPSENKEELNKYFQHQ